MRHLRRPCGQHGSCGARTSKPHWVRIPRRVFLLAPAGSIHRHDAARPDTPASDSSIRWRDRPRSAAGWLPRSRAPRPARSSRGSLPFLRIFPQPTPLRINCRLTTTARAGSRRTIERAGEQGPSASRRAANQRARSGRHTGVPDHRQLPARGLIPVLPRRREHRDG